MSILHDCKNGKSDATFSFCAGSGKLCSSTEHDSFDLSQDSQCCCDDIPHQTRSLPEWLVAPSAAAQFVYAPRTQFVKYAVDLSNYVSVHLIRRLIEAVAVQDERAVYTDCNAFVATSTAADWAVLSVED